MEGAWLVAAVVGLVLVAALFAWIAARVQREEPGPEAPPLRAPSPEIPADVQAVLDRLVPTETRAAAVAELEARGSEVVPHLIAALADFEAPWRPAVIDAIARIGDARAVRVLERIVVRGQVYDGTAIWAIAAIADEHSVDVLVEWLRNSSPPGHASRNGPLHAGVVYAARHGRVGPRYRAELSVELADRVGEGIGRSEPSAAAALVALDREAAVHVLTSAEVLGRGPDAIGEALDALMGADVPIDPDLAASLADALPLRPVETVAEDSTLSIVLAALALSGHPGARARIESFRRVDDRATRDAAVYALGLLEGVTDAESVVASRLDAAGFEGLTPAQRTWHLVASYVGAGDHAAWFSDGHGPRADATVAALREIGADAAAAVLTDACALFTGGVPSDAEEICARVEKASSGDRPPFADLDERLHAAADDVESRLGEFALAHAADFRSPEPDEPGAASDDAA